MEFLEEIENVISVVYGLNSSKMNCMNTWSCRFREYAGTTWPTLWKDSSTNWYDLRERELRMEDIYTRLDNSLNSEENSDFF